MNNKRKKEKEYISGIQAAQGQNTIESIRLRGQTRVWLSQNDKKERETIWDIEKTHK